MTENNSDPVIVHVDMDAFFARAEKLDHPSLRGEPVIVGGLGPRGVVSTACYRAREYGVHSAMPMAEARERCPQAAFRSPRTDRYSELSAEIRETFRQVSPFVKPLSLDEAYLDVTGVLHRYDSHEDLAQTLRNRIQEQTGLTASVGVGPNTMIAKLASDQNKPDGYTIVPSEKREAFLRPLPIDALPGFGPAHLKTFEDEGIKTIGDLQDRSRDELTRVFGQQGIVYDRKSKGYGSRVLNLQEETKSISHEETYPENLHDEEELLDRLHHLTEKTARRLRNKEFEAQTVFLKLRRGDFTTFTRQRTVTDPLSSTESIWNRIQDIFRQDVSLDNRGVRLQGVGLSSLRDRDTQHELFEQDPKNRREDLNDLADEINKSMGEGSLVRGRSLRQKDDSDNDS